MPIEIIWEEREFRPTVLCDGCGKKITDREPGHVEWGVVREADTSQPERGNTQFLHRDCYRSYEREHSEYYWYSMSLEDWLTYIHRNVFLGPWPVAKGKLEDVLEGDIGEFNAPGQHIYIVRDDAGEVLYVGKTIKPTRSRLRQHIETSSQLGATIKEYAPESYAWPVELLATKDDLDELERKTIRRLCPALNKRHYIKGELL